MAVRIVKGLLLSGIVLIAGCASFGKGAPARGAADVVGEWNQCMLVGRSWIYGGTFSVSRDGSGGYSMVMTKRPSEDPVETDVGVTHVIPSRGLFDVSFDGLVWSFNSDWGEGNIGAFRLKAESGTVFVGYSYLRGERQTFNRWERVGKQQDGSRCPGTASQAQSPAAEVDPPGAGAG